MWIEIKDRILLGMNKSVDHFKNELSKIRGNRPSAAMVDSIKFKDSYGNETAIKYVSSITTSDTSITIQPWDSGNIKSIEKAIIDANVGLTPSSSSSSIIIQVPKLTVEKINEMVKHISSISEEAKISIRNVRRVLNDDIKKLQKSGDISEDDEKKFSNELQKITDDYTKQVEDLFKKKEEEIRKI
jgi:ribosome recycling factor